MRFPVQALILKKNFLVRERCQLISVEILIEAEKQALLQLERYSEKKENKRKKTNKKEKKEEQNLRMT